MSRTQYVAFVACGPAANLVLLMLTIVLDQVAPYYDAILVPAGVAQVLLLLVTLAPMKHATRRGVRPSDGLQLWTQLVRKPGDMFTTQYTAVMRLVFTKDQPWPPPSPSAPDLVYHIARSDRMIDPSGMRDAVASVRTLLSPWQLTLADRAVALDFLASAEVLFGETGATEAELEAWSAEACCLAPGLATSLTRAGVLATTGRGEQAMDLLLAMPEESKPTAAIFRYWLHMAQAAKACGFDEAMKESLHMARQAGSAKVAQRGVMTRSWNAPGVWRRWGSLSRGVGTGPVGGVLRV